MDENLRRKPTAYYCPQSGIGLALNSLSTAQSQKIGIVGLGVGTLATYGRAGNEMRMYEINDQVLDLAKIEAGKLELEYRPFQLNLLVEDIAERIGVTKGTVYVYFPTKDDLVSEVILAMGIQLQHTLAAAFSGRAPDHLVAVAGGFRGILHCVARLPHASVTGVWSGNAPGLFLFR